MLCAMVSPMPSISHSSATSASESSRSAVARSAVSLPYFSASGRPAAAEVGDAERREQPGERGVGPGLRDRRDQILH
jgi:hypothetical protein